MGYQKKLALQKKLFPPMPQITHIFMPFLLHNMPFALVGIPVIGYLGYWPISNMPFVTCRCRWPLFHNMPRSRRTQLITHHAFAKHTQSIKTQHPRDISSDLQMPHILGGRAGRQSNPPPPKYHTPGYSICLTLNRARGVYHLGGYTIWAFRCHPPP